MKLTAQLIWKMYSRQLLNGVRRVKKMSVSIKSAHEIELMRESCRRLSIVHKELEEAIRPGISTLDIDRLGRKLIRSLRVFQTFSSIMAILLLSAFL